MNTGYTGTTSFNVDSSFDSHDTYSSSTYSTDIFNEYSQETKGDTALWRGVITQALMDAGSNSKKQEFRKAKSEAIIWLNGQSEDFQLVCHYANLHPDYVKHKACEAIRRGCTWRTTNLNSVQKNRKKKKRLPLTAPAHTRLPAKHHTIAQIG